MKKILFVKMFFVFFCVSAQITDFKITPERAVIAKGGTVRLEAVSTPVGLVREASWEGSDNTVVKHTRPRERYLQDCQGLTYGKSVITARTTDGQFTATSEIFVWNAVNGIRFSSQNQNKFNLDYEGNLSVEVLFNSEADYIPVKSNAFYWESSDPSIISVTEQGKIKTLRLGTATITAKSLADNTSVARADFEVVRYITELKVSEDNIILKQNETKMVSPIYSPQYALTNFSWESENPAIAEVSSSGNITAKSNGKTKIVLKENYSSKEVKIDVYVYPEVKNLTQNSYQRNIHLTWEKALDETQWLVSYGKVGATLTNVEVSKPSVFLSNLEPGSQYQIKISSIIEQGKTSIPLERTITTKPLDLNKNPMFPHLLNLNEITYNKPFYLIWNDLKDTQTQMEFSLQNLSGSNNDSFRYDRENNSITISRQGSYILVVTFKNNGQNWKKLTYKIQVR